MRFFEKYDSWDAFLEAAKESGKKYPGAEGWRANSSDPWRGTPTWAKALTLAEEGWDEVRPEVERISETIKDDVRPLLLSTFRSDFDVAGAAVDIARFLDGEPECMVQLTPVKIAKPGRVISILVNVGATLGVSAATIRKRGAAVCALVEVLELLQHSTEVWVESTAEKDAQVATVLVKVKAAEDRLDIGKLSFALANPAMQRRLVFSRRQACGFGYGRNQGGSIELTQQATVQADVVLDTVLRHEVSDPAGWVRGHLEDFALLAPEPTP